jgi:dTDP-4-amino-4,6-dideoxygalactose transaminase
VPFSDLGAMHAEVSDALDDAWRRVTADSEFVGGAHAERFEKAWAAQCHTRHAVGTASGTDALQLTLEALSVGRGHEVIVPANTFVATAEAVVRAGARPRFVDVDPETLLLTAETVERAITPATRAVVVVHLFGNIGDMAALGDLAAGAGITLIEDAAQAHGATWRGRPAGSFGRAGCFSFYPGKNLGAFGDGGAVVTDDTDLAERIRSLGDHGRPRTSKQEHRLVGTTSRLDGLQAAVLSVKLPHLQRWTQARRRAVDDYRRLLSGSPVRLVPTPADGLSGHHLNVARVAHRDRVRSLLSGHGIETGIHYPIPCHRHKAYAAYCDGPLPVVERVAAEMLSLPLFPHIRHDQVETVCDALRRALTSGSARHAG